MKPATPAIAATATPPKTTGKMPDSKGWLAALSVTGPAFPTLPVSGIVTVTLSVPAVYFDVSQDKLTVFFSPGPSVTVVLATVIGPHLARTVNVSVVAALFVTSTATVTFWPTVTGPGLGVTDTVPRVGATKLNVSAIPPLTSTPS